MLTMDKFKRRPSIIGGGMQTLELSQTYLMFAAYMMPVR